MLLANDVLRACGPDGKAMRILWIDAKQEVAFTYQLDTPCALPQPARVAMLEADVRSRRLSLLLVDPGAPACPAAAVPEKHRELQARAWEVIAPLVASAPAIFLPRRRAEMIAHRVAETGVSRATILRYLRRYWERGQTLAALLPDYANSGAPGKIRVPNAHVKRGRPRKDASQPGLNADAQIRATFRTAVARYAATHAEFSRRGAYRQMLEDFFRERDDSSIPTFGQFKYWIERDAACALR